MALGALKEKVTARKLANKEETTTSIVTIDRGSIPLVEYTNDSDLNEYLHGKSLEILTLSSTGSLILGKLFLEVKEKLKDSESTYTEWLGNHGQNKMTASRYVNRYTLYTEVTSEEAKAVVALLPEKTLASIRRIDYTRYVDLINKGATLKEIKEDIAGFDKNKLPPKTQEDEGSTIESVFDFGSYMSVLDFITQNGKLETLSVEKQIELSKCFKKIKKLLGVEDVE